MPCIPETKMKIRLESISRSEWGGRWVSYDFISAQGNVGVTLILWDDRKLVCGGHARGA